MLTKTSPAGDNTITFACPKCHLRTKVSLDRIGHIYHCRVQCTCGNLFSAEIEFRERRRRQIDLPGTYQPIGQAPAQQTPTAPDNCRVIDISLTGLAFLKSADQALSQGQLLRLNFHLDDSENSEIVQECEVRHLKENFVGCLIRKIDPALEYYLLG